MDTVNPIDRRARRAGRASWPPTGVRVRRSAAGSTSPAGASRRSCPIDHLPNLLAGSERYTPRGHGRPRADDAERGRVRRHARPRRRCGCCPWDRRFAWMAADLSFGGREPFALCTAVDPQEAARRWPPTQGCVFNLGVETEFYVFQPESLDRPDGYLVPMAPQRRSCARPGLRRRGRRMDAMPLPRPDGRATWRRPASGCSASTPRAATGSTSSTSTTPRRSRWPTGSRFFRLMVKQVAKQAGLHRHVHAQAVHRRLGVGPPLQHEPRGRRDRRQPVPRRRRRARQGLEQDRLLVRRRHHHATPGPSPRWRPRRSTPTSGSRPRLADGTVSWAPMYAAYGDNNRSCMLRLPRNRPAVENRGVDSAANTYLTAALMLAAGLEGIAPRARPGRPGRGPRPTTGHGAAGRRGPAAPQPARGHRRLRGRPARARGVPRAVRHRLRRHEAAPSGTTTTARSPTGSAASTCSPSDAASRHASSPCSSAASRRTATRCTAGTSTRSGRRARCRSCSLPPAARRPVDRFVEVVDRLRRRAADRRRRRRPGAATARSPDADGLMDRRPDPGRTPSSPPCGPRVDARASRCSASAGASSSSPWPSAARCTRTSAPPASTGPLGGGAPVRAGPRASTPTPGRCAAVALGGAGR